MNNKYSEAEIVADIERHIVENGIAPGVKLSSAVQYALRYGVSAKTADRALNRLQKRGIIERRRGSGNFVKKNRHPSNRINVCFIWWHVPGIASLDFYPGNIFWQTLCQLMDEHQITYDIFFESHAQLEQPVNRLHKYDLMVVPAGLVMHNPDTFRNCRVPQVLYGGDQWLPGPWHQVIYDYRPGMMTALEYCRKERVKRIFLPGFDTEIVHHKHQAFMEAAAKTGFRPEDIRVWMAPGEPKNQINPAVEAGNMIAEYFLESDLRDHLIFSVSDFFTFGMFQVFNREKLVCGKDFRMISYDNFQKYMAPGSEYFNISSVTHPQQEHARAVVVMIEDISRQPDSGYFRNYITPSTEFVIR